MRILATIIFFTLTCLFSANAQQRQFEIGLKNSPSISSGYLISSANMNESAFSLNNGVEFRTYHKRRPIAFSMGVNLMDRGYQATKSFTQYQGSEEISTTRNYQEHNYYVNVPLMVGFSWENFMLSLDLA